MDSNEKFLDADEMPRTEYIEEAPISTARRVIKASADALNDPNFVMTVAHEWMKKKIDQFPKLCNETRKVNLLKRKQLADIGNAGGWSETKDFKFDYTIPKELYSFMTNMVDRNFWSDANDKTWRSFIEGIVKGDEPKFLLYKAKQHFDGNELTDKLKVIN